MTDLEKEIFKIEMQNFKKTFELIEMKFNSINIYLK